MNHGEVFIPAKPQLKTLKNAVLEKYTALAEGYKPRDKVVLTLSIKDGDVVMLDDDGNVLARALDDILRHKQVCDRNDLLGFAYRRAEWTKESWGVDCSVVEDGDVVKVIAHLTAFDAFLEDVMRGLVRDPETGRKLSPAQVSGKPPEGGFLQEVLKNCFPSTDFYKGYEWAKAKGVLGYARGVVVKICGDFDADLDRYHNCYGVIIKVLDAYHYKIVVANSIPPKTLTIRDCDVKGIIGDMLNDYIGIGAERHKKEIVPLIERALAGKVPLTPKCQPSFWPRPPVQQAVVVVSVRYRGFNRRNVVRAIRDTERGLEAVEKLKQKGRFYCEGDYRYISGIYTLWLKLYRIVLNHLDRLERGEDAVKLYTSSVDRRKMVSESLTYAGIPHIATKDGFIAPRQLILRMGLPIV